MKKPAIMSVISRGVPTMRYPFRIPFGAVRGAGAPNVCADEYPSEQTHFHVRGYDVAIENEDLANALTVLPDDKRDIVLLAYFLDMTDQEIADKLDMVRCTVQYKRAQSLKELKKEMEVTEDGAQSE